MKDILVESKVYGVVGIRYCDMNQSLCHGDSRLVVWQIYPLLLRFCVVPSGLYWHTRPPGVLVALLRSPQAILCCPFGTRGGRNDE